MFTTKSRVPAKRPIFDDAAFFDESVFLDEATDAAWEVLDDFDGNLDARALHGYVVGQRLGSYNKDCDSITAALADRPLIGMGTRQTRDGCQEAWFIIENMHYVRSQVCDDQRDCFRCWDENGRFFVEAYDRASYDAGIQAKGSLFEVRQLNERGVRLLDSCLGDGKPVPVERLFSPRYSDAPRIAERAFGFGREQWEEADPSPALTAACAQQVARNLSGTLSGGTAKASRRF